jgi:hypothetical protein
MFGKGKPPTRIDLAARVKQVTAKTRPPRNRLHLSPVQSGLTVKPFFGRPTEVITPAQRAIMLACDVRSAAGENIDPNPVVKLFTPDGACAWLLTELDPEDPDVAFGLCDLGMRFPELGSVRLFELMAVRGALGLAVERDVHVTATRTLGEYADAAMKAGAIRA